MSLMILINANNNSIYMLQVTFISAVWIPRYSQYLMMMDIYS